MMGLFDEIKNTVLLFMDYCRHMYKQKTIKLLSPRESKSIPLVILKEDVSTTLEINKQIIQTTSIAATTLLKELRDHKKTTSDHLTRTKGKFSPGETSHNTYKDGLGKITVNDPAESSFGATTRQL